MKQMRYPYEEDNEKMEYPKKGIKLLYLKQHIRLGMSSSILFPTNEYATSNKSPEEIQKLMMPQQPQLDTLIHILNKAHPLQLPYAYRNIHNYPIQTLNLVCSRLPKQDHDNQVLIVQSLKKITPDKVNSTSIVIIFDSLVDALQNWTTINTQHLVQALQFIVEISLRKAQLLGKLQKIVLEMGKPSQPIISKVMAGRIVPILSKYSGRSLKSELIDIIKRIISDSQAEAKKVFLNEIFPKLLQNLKLQFIQLHFQQKIYQTVYDENEQIGLMALETILRNATKFSIEEQSSRIVKLFIDSMTSKNEKIAAMITGFMGQIYQKLQGIILKNQTNCIKFWKSIIEVAESKNQKILNNFIFNLPGILLLTKKYHRVDSLCEVYCQLFFNPDADTLLLVSYFHEMVQMFPSRVKLLKETAYHLFSQIFEEAEPTDDSLKIADCLMTHLYQCRQAFMEEREKEIKDRDESQNSTSKTLNDLKSPYFESAFNDILTKYLVACLNKKNGCYISNIYKSISKCVDFFTPLYAQTVLIPKLYSAIRSKSVYLHCLVQLIVSFLARDSSSVSLINNYASKFNVQLSKSTKSHQRQAAMLFFYYCSYQFSIDTFHQFKMGEKFLQFNNQKNLKNKLLFIKYLPRLIYFFTRQEKIEYTIILTRMRKDSDAEVIRAIQQTSFTQKEQQKALIMAKSKEIKEKQKMRTTLNSRKLQFANRRQVGIKQLRKQDVLKKRLQTRSRTKMLIKQLPKKKTPMTMSRPPRKNPPL